MVMSKKLTPERIAEIMAFPITYDEDCPKLTKKQLAELRPAHPENFVKEKRFGIRCGNTSAKNPLSAETIGEMLALAAPCDFGESSASIQQFKKLTKNDAW